VARFRAASEANDIEAMMASLAPDAALVSPVSGRLVFRGHPDLRVLLGAVYGALGEVRCDGPGAPAEDGRIRQIRPHLRPWLALTLLALKLGPKLASSGILRRALRSAA